MTTETSQQKGGTAQGANLPAKNGDKSPVKQSPKGELIEIKPIKENGPLSVEETIRKVNELQENIDTRELLQSHHKAVSSLRFGEFDPKDRIVLESHTGEKYPITSPSLNSEVSELIKRRIKEHIDEVEQLIVL